MGRWGGGGRQAQVRLRRGLNPILGLQGLEGEGRGSMTRPLCWGRRGDLYLCQQLPDSNPRGQLFPLPAPTPFPWVGRGSMFSAGVGFSPFSSPHHHHGMGRSPVCEAAWPRRGELPPALPLPPWGREWRLCSMLRSLPPLSPPPTLHHCGVGRGGSLEGYPAWSSLTQPGCRKWL